MGMRIWHRATTVETVWDALAMAAVVVEFCVGVWREERQWGALRSSREMPAEPVGQTTSSPGEAW